MHSFMPGLAIIKLRLYSLNVSHIGRGLDSRLGHMIRKKTNLYEILSSV